MAVGFSGSNGGIKGMAMGFSGSNGGITLPKIKISHNGATIIKIYRLLNK